MKVKPTKQQLEEALNFLKEDGWIVSAVRDTDVPRVMVQFAAMKLEKAKARKAVA